MMMAHYYCYYFLLLSLSLLGCSCYNHNNDNASESEKILSSERLAAWNLSTFSVWPNLDAEPLYITEDRFNNGSFYALVFHALISIDANGNYSLVAGSMDYLTGLGFINGLGSAARFNFEDTYSVSLAQLDAENLIVADNTNRCLRRVYLPTKNVSTYAGNCGNLSPEVSGRNLTNPYWPGENATAYDTRFKPNGIVYDMRRDYLYISDREQSRIYKYDIKKDIMSVLWKTSFSYPHIMFPTALLLNEAQTILYVALHQVVASIDLDSHQYQFNVVSGHKLNVNESHMYGNVPTTLSNAVYGNGSILSMSWLIPDKFIIVVDYAGRYNSNQPRTIRLIGLADETVTTLCASIKSNSSSSFWKGVSDCALESPRYAAVASNMNLYIGAGPYSSTTQGVHIKDLTDVYSEIECKKPHALANGSFNPIKDKYIMKDTIEYTCDVGMALIGSKNRVCKGYHWTGDNPTCNISQIKNVLPTSGQEAGGSLITVTGILPSSMVITVNGEPVTYTGDVNKVVFKMLPRFTGSPNQTVTINFKDSGLLLHSMEYVYSSNPTLINGTQDTVFKFIVSGGLQLKFSVQNQDSAKLYQLVMSRNESSIQVTCSMENYLKCVTANISEFLLNEANLGKQFYDVHAYLTSDGVTIVNLSRIYIYNDPVFNLKNFTIYPDDGEVITTLSGKYLSAVATVNDYNVNIENVGSCKLNLLESNKLEFTIPDVKRICTPSNQPCSSMKITVSVGNIETTVGYLHVEETVGPMQLLFSAKLGIGLAAVVVALCVGVFVFMKCRTKQVLERDDEERFEPTWSHKLFDAVNPVIKERLFDIMYEPDDLAYDPHSEPIGNGYFSCIYIGQLKLCGGITTKTVAVKTLPKTFVDDCQVRKVEDFLKEATLLLGYKHDNILSTIGVVWPDDSLPVVLLPYMHKRDLHALLSQEGLDFSVDTLLSFARQIACGMEFLAEKKFVHRDLAARNCLVDQANNVKIADFGLSKDVYYKDYYKDVGDKSSPRPIRWMAIESLQHGIYNSQTDMWSFGIVMWEIFSDGRKPYPTLQNHEILQYLVKGDRCFKPPKMYPEIFAEVMQCWSVEPNLRPTFQRMHTYLRGLTNYSVGLKHEYSIVSECTSPSSPEDNYSSIPSYSEVAGDLPLNWPMQSQEDLSVPEKFYTLDGPQSLLLREKTNLEEQGIPQHMIPLLPSYDEL